VENNPLYYYTLFAAAHELILESLSWDQEGESSPQRMEICTAKKKAKCLVCLHKLWLGNLKLRTEDSIPESTGDPEAILVISKMVLEVILLQLAIICWKAI
jgi:hypothetical protein